MSARILMAYSRSRVAAGAKLEHEEGRVYTKPCYGRREVVSRKASHGLPAVGRTGGFPETSSLRYWYCTGGARKGLPREGGSGWILGGGR